MSFKTSVGGEGGCLRIWGYGRSLELGLRELHRVREQGYGMELLVFKRLMTNGIIGQQFSLFPIVR